jgi:hypothetical protein
MEGFRQLGGGKCKWEKALSRDEGWNRELNATAESLRALRKMLRIGMGVNQRLPGPFEFTRDGRWRFQRRFEK